MTICGTQRATGLAEPNNRSTSIRWNKWGRRHSILRQSQIRGNLTI